MLFADSPFSVVADRSTARCFSGPEQTRQSLLRLRQTLVRRPDQSLDVVWANFGAGKTHVLYHLAHLLDATAKDEIPSITCFVEMPEQIRSFFDLYRSISAGLPLDFTFQTILSAPDAAEIPDSLKKAANVYVNGGPRERALISQWFTGDRPHLTELRRCSDITQRIEDDVAASNALAGVIAASAAVKTRLVLLFDEFQRIGVLGTSARNRTLSSLRTIFSKSPRYFSVVVAVQSIVEKTALDMIPAELKTLIGRKPTISLPAMSQEEAISFLLGRFDYFREPGYGGARSAPFDDDAVRAVISYLHTAMQIQLIPRELLQAFAFVYDNAADLSSGINYSEATAIITRYGTGSADDAG